MFNDTFRRLFSSPVLCRCWWQQSPVLQRPPRCRGGGRSRSQGDGSQPVLCFCFSPPGCSRGKPGDCLQPDRTLKGDPCSWPGSKPVHPRRAAVDPAWFGETQSGRQSLHRLWSSQGGRWSCPPPLAALRGHHWHATQAAQRLEETKYKYFAIVFR